ncbi:MAG: phosphoribosylpyrophosphate synthetase [Bacteroidota bacterium]
MKQQYDTLLDAVNDLKKRGFTYDFTEQKDKLYCSEKQCDFNPNEFEIVEFYRFEGISDPEDNSIVYAISSDKNNIKGLLVNAYGVYSDTKVSELISKMKIADTSYQ